jgi:fructokinase
MTIVSIGEILWDVYPDSSRLGGASFNFAVHARRLGHRVIF